MKEKRLVKHLTRRHLCPQAIVNSGHIADQRCNSLGQNETLCYILHILAAVLGHRYFVIRIPTLAVEKRGIRTRNRFTMNSPGKSVIGD